MHNKKEISEANTFVVQCDLGLNANDFLLLPRRGKMKVSTNDFFFHHQPNATQSIALILSQKNSERKQFLVP